MKLSKRLLAIAELIPKNVRVIDVGCDHAFLDIYLTLQGTNQCIASDINNNVLKKTREIVSNYGLSEQIEIVKSDGLKEICLQEEDVVVIAGMGTSTILHIIEQKEPCHLVIQSNNDLKELREKIVKKGYIIQNEKVVYEKHIYYVIIVFERGIKTYTKQEFFLGPILMWEKSPVTLSYFEYLLETKKQIFKKIPDKNGNPLKEEIIDLEAVLDK